MNLFTTQKSLTLTILIFTALFTLTGCNDGEAEDAGEEIDEIVTDVGNAIEDKCEEVKEKLEAEDEEC
ncbi:MAG: hypothetical protein ACFHVJ_05285 [Aestuariibacter sp.]